MLRGLRGREARRSKSFSSVRLRASTEQTVDAAEPIREDGASFSRMSPSNIRRTKRRSHSAGEREKARTASWNKQLEQSKEAMGELLQAAILKLAALDRPKRGTEEKEEEEETGATPPSPLTIPGSEHAQVFDWLALRYASRS